MGNGITQPAQNWVCFFLFLELRNRGKVAFLTAISKADTEKQLKFEFFSYSTKRIF